MIGKLELVMVVVSDMERSLRFYRDVLGLGVEHESPHWSQLDAGTISIGLHPGAEERPAPDESPVQLAFYVEDAEQAVGELRSAGAEVAQEPVEEPFGGYLAVIRDPDGHAIQLLQGWPSTHG
jgi:predicted enzyme related to lactoylglutathione lyase